MTNHHSTQPLAEDKIKLPDGHALRSLTPVGLILGLIGLAATFLLSTNYSSPNLWGHSTQKHGLASHKKETSGAKKAKQAHKSHSKQEKAAHTSSKKVSSKHEKNTKTHNAKAPHSAKAHGGHTSKPQVWGSYLVALLFFLTIGLGGFMFVLIHFATQAGWSVTSRRLAEFAIGALPFLALLFIPFYVYGRGTLYHHWMVPDMTDKILVGKLGFLNDRFFTYRAIFYFAFWILVGTWFARNSMLQDRVGGKEISRKMRKWSYVSIFLFAWTTTFAAFDWVMSIDPHWYSTIFGVYFFAGIVMAFHSFLALFVHVLHGRGFLNGIITTEHKHDIGKMMFAFAMFWTYMAFSQFMLIWYGNIPEETMWFQYRMHGQWTNLSILLVVGHFIVPFFFLMSRHIKRNAITLSIGAVWLLFIHLVDLYWLVMPTLYNGHGGTIAFHWIDLLPLLTSFVAVGGFFLAGLGWWMRSAYLIPRQDPRLAESLAFENF